MSRGSKPAIFYDVRGERLSLRDLAARSERSPSNIFARIRDGMTPEVAAFGPRSRKEATPRKQRLVEHAGETITCEQLALRAHLSVTSVCHKLDSGMSVEDVLAGPRRRGERQLDLHGDKIVASKLAALCGISVGSVNRRLKAGDTPAQIVAMPKKRAEENLTDREFEKLTVVGVYDRRPHRATRWRCSCSCGSGKEVRAYGHDLRSGKVRSCGCLVGRQLLGTGVNLVDREFGRLTVIAPAVKTMKNGRRERVWTCRCSCTGVLVENVRTSWLVHGNEQTWSCGCLRREGLHLKRYDVFGQMLTLLEMEALSGYSTNTLRRRMEKGKMTPEEAVSSPRERSGPRPGSAVSRYTLDGARITLNELAVKSGWSVVTLVQKLKDGETPERLVGAGRKPPA